MDSNTKIYKQSELIGTDSGNSTTFVGEVITTDDTLTVVAQFPLPLMSAATFVATVVAIQTGGSDTESIGTAASWTTFRGLVKNNEIATSVGISDPAPTYYDADCADLEFNIVIPNPADFINFTVEGLDNRTYKWTYKIEYTLVS